MRFGIAFFTSASDMLNVAEKSDKLSDIISIVGFITTKMLLFLLRRLWSFNDDIVENSFYLRYVMTLCARDDQRNGHAIAVCKQMAFGSAFATIGGIGPCFFLT